MLFIECARKKFVDGAGKAYGPLVCDQLWGCPFYEGVDDVSFHLLCIASWW